MARQYIEFFRRERERGKLQQTLDKKIAALVALAPDLAEYWLKAPRKWPEETRPAYRWARLVLGEGAIEAVVYLAKEVDQDRVAMKLDVSLKKKGEAKIEILVAHFDSYAAPAASAVLTRATPAHVARGRQWRAVAEPGAWRRERRRETWKARRDEAGQWAAQFLKERVVDELYTKGFF